jgi:hypothetical protein
MIKYKKIEPEVALRLIAQVLGENLPEEIKSSNAEMTLSFDDDHSVDVYLIEPDENTPQS